MLVQLLKLDLWLPTGSQDQVYYPTTIMPEVNYLKLVSEGRMNPHDARQAKIIESYLAFMDVENPEKATSLREHYSAIPAPEAAEEVVEAPVEEKPKKKVTKKVKKAEKPAEEAEEDTTPSE